MRSSESAQPHASSHAQATNLYETLPINGLRLIKFKSGAWQEQLDCQLETFRQDQIPPYIALSYVWGDLGKSIQIQLNSHHFNVTENLYGALRLLRASDSRKTKNVLHSYLRNIEPHWIWADAICINQTDPDDRLKQTPRMRQIYGQAERVVCWLGPSLDCDGGARYAFDASNKLHAWEQQWGNSSTDEEWVLAFQNEVEDRDRLANELLGIMRRPWFSRIWTVQEAVLATSDPLMVLGGLVAPARALSIGMTMLMLHNQETRLIHASHAYSGLRIIDIMRAAERRRPRDDSDRTMSAFAQRLYRAISLTASSYACTVPHDMIYGLLGLACPPSHLPDRLTPAYDISFQDLYREYTRFLIEATGELVVLEKCLGNFPDQPSWVADFRQQIPLFLSISTQTSPSPLVSFTHAGRRLTVQGTVSGKSSHGAFKPA